MSPRLPAQKEKDNKRKSPAAPLEKEKVQPTEKKADAANKIFKPQEPKKKPVSNQGQRPVSEDVNRDRIKVGIAKEGVGHKSEEGFLKEPLLRDFVRGDVPKELLKEQKERNRSPFSYRKEVNQLQPQNLKEKIVPVLQKKDGNLNR